MTSPVDLTLLAEHRRGHGALYDALSQGCIDADRLRKALAALPQPKAADGRLVLAVEVSPWLRPDAPISPDRLFCHVYGRSGRSSDQFIPGWPYSFVAALETGRTSWCQLLDAVRLGPDGDVAEVTARQVRRAGRGGASPAVSSCQGEVVHGGDGLDGVVEAITFLTAVAEDFPVLHAGEGVLDAGTDPAVLGVVLFLAA